MLYELCLFFLQLELVSKSNNEYNSLRCTRAWEIIFLPKMFTFYLYCLYPQTLRIASVTISKMFQIPIYITSAVWTTLVFVPNYCVAKVAADTISVKLLAYTTYFWYKYPSKANSQSGVLHQSDLNSISRHFRLLLVKFSLRICCVYVLVNKRTKYHYWL